MRNSVRSTVIDHHSSATPASSRNGKRNLKTFTQFSRDHEAFPESSLRWIRFCSSPGRKNSLGEPIPVNGFAEAFVQIGRRVYIDEDKFFEILDSKS